VPNVHTNNNALYWVDVYWIGQCFNCGGFDQSIWDDAMGYRQFDQFTQNTSTSTSTT